MSREADVLVRKVTGGATARTGAESATDDSALALFGDWRDQRLLDAFGVTISTLRRQMRAEFAEELAERDPQLRKIAALELRVAELTGAIAMLRGAAPPPPANFPRVKAWTEDTVYHELDVVTFAGGTYQAKHDTARVPGSQDWTCVAAAGAGFSIRGTYDANEEYKRLDVAMVNGSSFVALKDAPGLCPGPDWRLLASRGSRGSRGERGVTGIMGLRGERGQAAPTIRSWEIDRARYTMTPVMSDGSKGPPLELRGLFEQFLLETSDG